VLLSTTIVENGLDIPNANTIIINRADRYGLAQLYQLRGRVGRRGSRAYAYLLHPADRVLSEEAYERLKAIGEFTDLGSGFKLAMRDLEIRGAGNLLGGAQSGHIAAVGFDLYCELVTEAVGELKGEPKVEEVEVVIDIPVDAHLPREYVSRDDVRMEAYRRLAAVTTEAEVDDIRAEWVDRYGPVPAPAEALLSVARLRAECARTGVRELSVAKNVARILPLTLKTSQSMRLTRLVKGAVYKEDLAQIVVPLPPGTDPAPFLVDLLRQLVDQQVASTPP
jgi:transcription-repair coupling factor (superfamily II helicase)